MIFGNLTGTLIVQSSRRNDFPGAWAGRIFDYPVELFQKVGSVRIDVNDLCDLGDLIQRGQTGHDFGNTGFHQRPHAVIHGLFEDERFGGSVKNKVLDLIIDLHDLEDGTTAVKTGAVAIVATAAAVKLAGPGSRQVTLEFS